MQWRTVPVLILLLAATVAILDEPLRAQSDPRPADRFAEELEVTEVLLDVLVTDGRGHVVAGLGIEDFIVMENRKLVELTGVDFYSTSYGVEPPAPGMPEETPASRYFIFFFHDQRKAAVSAGDLMTRQLDAARRSKEWLAEAMLPSDWIAVAGYDVKLEIQQDFTQDRELLYAAINRAATGAEPEPLTRSERKSLSPELPSLLVHLPDEWELRRETKRIYDGIQVLSEATGHIVGRKNLLLFSIGFGEIQSTPGTARPDQRFYPAMVNSLNDNNVAVYPLDLTSPGVQHLQSDFLGQLADDTGGVYSRHFVNFLTPLREISDDTTGYYLLSYRTEHPAGKSGFQKVKVRTREKKLKVRARKGYVYGSSE